MDIPVVLHLWEHANFTGRRRTIVQDTSDLALQEFNDVASSVTVEPGPGYEDWTAKRNGKQPTVVLYEHANFQGAGLELSVGNYPRLDAPYNFNDIVSSVRIDLSLDDTTGFSRIACVVDLYKGANFTGSHIVLTAPSASIAADFGAEFNDVITSVRVTPGPNFRDGDVAELFRDSGFLGGSVTLPPGDYPDLGLSHGFSDVVSSVRTRGGSIASSILRPHSHMFPLPLDTPEGNVFGRPGDIVVTRNDPDDAKLWFCTRSGVGNNWTQIV